MTSEIALGIIFIALIFIIFFIFSRMNLKNNPAKINFNEEYNKLGKRARNSGNHDEWLLCRVVLLPCYLRYNDKDSCFYKDIKAIFALFSFIYANLMLNIIIDSDCKRNIQNNLFPAFNIFNNLFMCDSKEIVAQQYISYKQALDEKLNILDIFLGVVENTRKNNDDLDIKKQLLSYAEITAFFTKMLPAIIDSAAQWNAMNVKSKG